MTLYDVAITETQDAFLGMVRFSLTAHPYRKIAGGTAIQDLTRSSFCAMRSLPYRDFAQAVNPENLKDSIQLDLMRKFAEFLVKAETRGVMNVPAPSYSSECRVKRRWIDPPGDPSPSSRR